MNKNDLNTLDFAKSLRLNAVKMVNSGKSSHIGSILSSADILAVLFGSVLNLDPKNPKWEDRDRFILSKGHAGAGVYAALAERGFFKEDLLKDHYQNGSIFSGHVSHKGVPGVELSTGSLGHGLPVATGVALADKINKIKKKTFVLLSDGELDEGSNWESLLFSSHHKLNNLVIIIDYNKLQSIDFVKNTLNLEPLKQKVQSFGCKVVSVDGHNFKQLEKVLSSSSTKPLVIIANTIKGKGVSFMENSVLWHYKSLNSENYQKAMKIIK